MPSRRGGGRRQRDQVVLTARDIRLTADALTRHLPAAEREVPTEPVTFDEILESMGPGSRSEKISRLAMAMSGTSERSSRAYKSARRSMERYTTTATERRRPSLGRLQSIAKIVRRPHLDVRQALKVQMLADVIYVGQQKQMPAAGPQEIPASRLSRVRERLRSGDEIDAAIELLNVWVHVYGLNTEPVAQGVIGNIEWITVELA